MLFYTTIIALKSTEKNQEKYNEAINHKRALELIFENLNDVNVSLNEKLIKDINKTINENIKGTSGYRKLQVFIQGSKHIPPKPEQIPNLMNHFVYNYNHDVADIYTKISNYHIQFETIHPFKDGNGRTGRLLINYELLKNNLPPIVISKEDRVKYFEYLRTKDCKGLAQWIQELSKSEKERMQKFGYLD